jgi:hypothetical protein
VTPDGQLAIDAGKLSTIKMGSIMKDSLISENSKPKVDEKGGEYDEDSDSDGSKQSAPTEIPGETSYAGSSKMELPERPKLNLDYWHGTEEEAVEAMNMIERRHKDPARKFYHPTREEESDVFAGPLLITELKTLTPEQMRAERQRLREKGVLPQINPSKPCLSEFDFTFSDKQKTPGGPRQKANKKFRIEGMSMFDPMIVRIATRLQ